MGATTMAEVGIGTAAGARFYFQRDVETMPRERLAALQLERLRATVRNAYDHVPLHRSAARRRRRRPPRRSRVSTTCARCRSRSRPTCATTIRSGCSRGRVAGLARLHASSGTTGKPTVVGYTRTDSRHLGRPDGALDRVRRGAPRRRDPQRVRLRPLHRRARRALRRRAARRHRRADVGRLDRAAGRADRGLRRARAVRDALVRARDRRGGRTAWASTSAHRGSRSDSSAPSRGARRCAARSRRGWACARSTSTASPRSWAPASRANASASPACTAGRITSCSR